MSLIAPSVSRVSITAVVDIVSVVSGFTSILGFALNPAPPSSMSMSPISPFAIDPTLNFTAGVPDPPKCVAGTSKISFRKTPVPALDTVTLLIAFPEITTLNAALELPVVLCDALDI